MVILLLDGFVNSEVSKSGGIPPGYIRDRKSRFKDRGLKKIAVCKYLVMSVSILSSEHRVESGVARRAVDVVIRGSD